MAGASGQAEDDLKSLPAIAPEETARRSGGWMVTCGVALALVAGSAALFVGLGWHHERPAERPTAADAAPVPARATVASARVEGSLKLPPRPHPALEDAVPPAPEPDAQIEATALLAPAPAPDLAHDPASTDPAAATSPGLFQPPLPARPLMQALPDPVSSASALAAWNPVAANGLPAPPPEKPPVPANVRTLPPVDADDMIEVTADGQRLPKVSPAGWMPWIAYARRYNPERTAARVGVLMINVGASEALTRRAVEQLPGEVSLAFLPNTPDLNRWIQTARDYGHEAYLMLPVEDPGGPAERGIKPIETSVDAAENLRRLRAVMAKATGYVGFVIPFPGPVSQSEATLRPVMKEISDRGLGIVELNAARTAPLPYRLSVELGMGYARNASMLDFKATRQAIDENLNRMVDWASETAPGKAPRHAFGVVQPSTAAIDAIVAWRQRLAGQPAVSLLPVIGHFECREACVLRVRRLQEQLRQ